MDWQGCRHRDAGRRYRRRSPHDGIEQQRVGAGPVTASPARTMTGFCDTAIPRPGSRPRPWSVRPSTSRSVFSDTAPSLWDRSTAGQAEHGMRSAGDRERIWIDRRVREQNIGPGPTVSARPCTPGQLPRREPPCTRPEERTGPPWSTGPTYPLAIPQRCRNLRTGGTASTGDVYVDGLGTCTTASRAAPRVHGDDCLAQEPRVRSPPSTRSAFHDSA